MTIPRRVGALFACALMAAAVACSNAGAGGEIGTATSFNVVRYPEAQRKEAPALEGPRLQDGPAVRATTVQGKVAVVNFWGSWCGPCRKEQPLLEQLSKEYSEQGVVFVGVNTRRDQRAAALAFIDEFSVTYPSIFDPDSSLAYRFGVRVMPATIVIDREGKIAAKIIGALRNEADLRLILEEEAGT